MATSRDSASKLSSIHVVRAPLEEPQPARAPRGTPPQFQRRPPPTPSATLLGMAPMRDATHDTVIDGTHMGIAPGQVTAAIERVKAQAGTESTQRTRDNKWREFEELGLRNKPSAAANKAGKLVVSTYRLLGFGILTVIVVVLLGYIGTTAFYLLNHTWVTPVAISPSDEKIVALQTQLAAQQNERERIAGDLEQAERAIAAEQAFEIEFAKAIKHDLAGRKAALARVQELAHAAASTRAEIRRTNGDYSESTAGKMADDYKAGLIDRQQMLAGKYQLAQISSSNLTLAERQADFEQRAAELATETASLDAILADKSAVEALSYDVLKIKRDYDASKLELAKDLDARERLRGSLARQEQIVAGLKQSAYLRALADHAVVALVPYGNLDNATKGSTLYACRVQMVACHAVGKILEVLPGEIQLKHPHCDTQLRGRMIEMQLTDATAAEDDVLFAGGKPLGL